MQILFSPDFIKAQLIHTLNPFQQVFALYFSISGPFSPLVQDVDAWDIVDLCALDKRHTLRAAQSSLHYCLCMRLSHQLSKNGSFYPLIKRLFISTLQHSYTTRKKWRASSLPGTYKMAGTLAIFIPPPPKYIFLLGRVFASMKHLNIPKN